VRLGFDPQRNREVSWTSTGTPERWKNFEEISEVYLRRIKLMGLMDACFHTEKHGEKKRATPAKVYITDYQFAVWLYI